MFGRSRLDSGCTEASKTAKSAAAASSSRRVDSSSSKYMSLCCILFTGKGKGDVGQAMV